MSRVHEGMEDPGFGESDTVEKTTVCARSGKLPSTGCAAQTEWIAKDNIPKEQCHDAACQSDCFSFISGIIVPDLAAFGVHVGFGEQIRIVSAFPQGGQLVAANLFLFRIGGSVLFLRHCIKTSLRR